MIGVCIKAGISCPSCESNIPINAMVPEIRCTACGTAHQLSLDTWKTILDDAIEEAPYTEEGTGGSSTVFGSFNFRIEYGRLMPRYEGTKDTIPEAEILGNLDNLFLTRSGTDTRTSVRPLPEAYREEFRGVVALVGEEEALIPGQGEGMELDIDDSSRPVAIQCPQCGGSLIVDGKRRSENCRYCESSVHLPDDLWRMLHPAPVMKRWFLLYDRSIRPFRWESRMMSAVYAGDGRVCVIIENDNGDFPVVACLNRDRTPAWIRDDLQVKCDTEGQPPGMMNAPEDRFLVMSDNERDLLLVSFRDGSLVRVIQASETEEGISPQDCFTMENVGGVACLPDGTIIQLRRITDEKGLEYSILMRFDLHGNRLPLWSLNEEEEIGEKGFLARVKDWFASRSSAPSIPCTNDLGNHPVKIEEYELDMHGGPDGSLYMLRYTRLAAFDVDGIKRYIIQLPCSSVYGRPVADEAGQVYIIAGLEDGRTEILRVSADGKEIVTRAASSENGGPVEDGVTLVLEPEGLIHLFGYSGEWQIIENETGNDKAGSEDAKSAVP